MQYTHIWQHDHGLYPYTAIWPWGIPIYCHHPHRILPGRAKFKELDADDSGELQDEEVLAAKARVRVRVRVATKVRVKVRATTKARVRVCIHPKCAAALALTIIALVYIYASYACLPPMCALWP